MPCPETVLCGQAHGSTMQKENKEVMDARLARFLGKLRIGASGRTLSKRA